MKSPCFQFYTNDFLGSPKVVMMSTAQVGAYTLLLILDWQEDGFVYNEPRLAKWCRMKPKEFRAAWETTLNECFVERDARFWNPRLERERTKQAEWREKSHKGGIASGQSRAKGGSTTVQPDGSGVVDECLNTPSPSPFPSPVTTNYSSPAAKTREADQVLLIPLDPIPPPTPSWPAIGAAHWSEKVGPIDPPRYGRAMKPMVDQYGWPDSFNAQKAYIDVTDGVKKVEYLRDDAVRMIRLGKMGLTNPETDRPTERGLLVDRSIRRSM